MIEVWITKQIMIEIKHLGIRIKRLSYSDVLLVFQHMFKCLWECKMVSFAPFLKNMMYIRVNLRYTAPTLTIGSVNKVFLEPAHCAQSEFLKVANTQTHIC